MFNFSLCVMCVWISVWYGDLVHAGLGKMAKYLTTNCVTVVIFTKYCTIKSFRCIHY